MRRCVLLSPTGAGIQLGTDIYITTAPRLTTTQIGNSCRGMMHWIDSATGALSPNATTFRALPR